MIGVDAVVEGEEGTGVDVVGGAKRCVNSKDLGLKRGWKCTPAAFRAGPPVGETCHSRVPAERKDVNRLGFPEIHGGNGEGVNS